MAKSPERTTRPAQDDRVPPRKRGNAVTDYLDASEPLERKGFAEAPQAEFTGAPLSGSISDWAEQISQEAERDGQAVEERPSKTKPSKKVPERSASPTRTARGTSMGGAASAKERAAAGLNPVAGLDIALEDA